MTQYTDNYSSCPNEIQNIVANSVNVLDEYVLFQTGQNEWTALIHTIGLNKTKKLVFSRNTQQGYNNTYIVRRYDDVEFEAIYYNEYYTFSNMGYGKSLDLPVYDGVISWSLLIIACSLMFAIVFKGALFKCLEKRR